ncbi:MAG: hypothetical protein OZSIB_3160 [Candidatus Ozemobacter sibiricus]|jgi:hypothetical protein|uniref:Uncharacterized protein n=1 Tax=Candidatus Ozemobacter sibiricus TaxID=2268124 RepID=A0A367ZQI8_9BACT|nr:MAG: hypothetical protein OZSIB_3160 [Candidatus Ozemobacter sibiricus]
MIVPSSGRLRSLLAVLILLVLGLAAGQPGAAQSAGFSIDATVDRTKVRFGESFQLLITVTQRLSGGGTERIGAPQVSQIPGFDIVGQRTSHNTMIINGIGQIQLQTAVELVPQKAGEFTIPALSMQGPDGKIYSTRPIPITVLPPAPDDEAPGLGEAEPAAGPGDQGEESRSGSRLANILVVALVILGSVIGAPILLTWLLNRNVKPSTRWQDEEPATITATTTGGPRRGAAETRAARPVPPIEDAQITRRESPPAAPASGAASAGSTGVAAAVSGSTPSRATGGGPRPSTPAPQAGPRVAAPPPLRDQVDFEREVTALQRLHPEADLEFYRSFFDLFRRAALGRSARLDPHMTPDEMVQSLLRTLPEPVGVRLRRLADDWEGVAFAHCRPARTWSTILEDALAVLAAIPSQE